MNPLLPELPAVVLAGALWAAAVWSAWRSAAGRSPGLRAVLAGLRGIAAALALAIVFNPGRWVRRIKRAGAEWIVLLDRSHSMAWADAPGGASRFAYAAGAAARFARLAPAGRRVRILPFARALEAAVRPRAVRRLVPDGAGSDIAGAVQAVLNRFQSAPERLAGIVVVSDGACIPPADPGPAAERALAMHVPVNVLPVGGPVRVPDLALRPRRMLWTAFAGQKLGLIFDLTACGCGPVEPEVRLTGPGANVVRRVRVSGGETAECRFAISAPAHAGWYRYTAAVPDWPGERNRMNNRVELSVQVLETRLRVLLAEGLPHWDSKFIARVLRRQNYIALTELYRLGPGRCRRIDPSNRPGAAAGFPRRLEQLEQYDIVIFGKAVDAFTAGAVAEEVRAFVEGGGVVIFARGRPSRASDWLLKDWLPLVWAPGKAAQQSWRPTDLGRRLGLFGELLPAPGASLWSALPPAPWLHRARAASPLSLVLIEAGRAGAAGAAIPVLAARRFGRGLWVCVNSGDLWQWDFFPKQPKASAFYHAFWPALLRWSLRFNDALPGREFAVRTPQRPVKLGQPVSLAVFARHPRRFVNSRTVLSLRVRRRGEARGIAVSAEPAGAGVWEAEFVPDAAGMFEATLAVPDRSGAERAVRGVFQVMPPPVEDANPSARPGFLRTLAAASGGQALSLDTLGAAVAAPAEVSPQNTAGRTWRPAWDRTAYYLLIAIALSVEWILRRRTLLS